MSEMHRNRMPVYITSPACADSSALGAEVALARHARRLARKSAVVITGGSGEGPKAHGAVVNQRKTALRKLCRHGLARARRLAGGRPNATFPTPVALDRLLGEKEGLRI